MKAFTETEVSKPRLIASLEAHRAADRIVQNTGYWVGNGDGRGCAVGCTIHDFRKGQEGNYALYGPLFGVPEGLARLEDTIFEGLAVEQAREWPLRFANAIPEGADLSRVLPAVLYRIIERRRDALASLVVPEDPARDKVLTAIEQTRGAMGLVLDVLARWRETGELDASAADSAWYAADSAKASRDEMAWIADVLIEEIEATGSTVQKRAP